MTTQSPKGSRPAHTPGPWTAHDDDGTGTMPCVLSEQVTAYGNFYVAQCHVYDDARLIAAAPDMLAALRAVPIARSPDPTAPGGGSWECLGCGASGQAKCKPDCWAAKVEDAIVKARGE